ncbi:MAG: hypothetical protein KF764_04045 [Labilithrix sp.]|nr:hypothetical protein [Labilithrix sp.]
MLKTLHASPASSFSSTPLPASPARGSLHAIATTSALAAVLALASGCGPERLPPPSAPAREVPADLDLPTEPPPAGAGRVVIDANGERAKVIEITGSATAAAGNYRATIIGLRPICTTPCVVDLPYGTHPLVLRSTTDPTRTSEVELDVGAKPKIVRHTLGERKDGGAAHTIGSSALVLGVVAALTGGLLWGLGELASKPGQPSSLVGTGQVITGIGAAGIVLSIPLLVVGRPTERPGATTEWSMPLGDEPHKAPSIAPNGASTTRL